MKKIIADQNMPMLDSFSALGEIIKVPGREWSNELVLDADILLTRSVTKVNAELLKNSRVQFVGTATSGFDHIDREYLKQNDIHFTYCPGSNAVSVAEYILSALLNVVEPAQALRGMTAGVIGCGEVGSRVIGRLEAIGIECILNDPPRQELTGDSRYSSLQDALSADIVTLHTPLVFDGNYPTSNLITAEHFQQMQSDVIFINAARGFVVNEADLLSHMAKKPTMKTIIDCWEGEPSINQYLLQQVDIGTPHIAGYSYDGKVKAIRMLFEAACDFFQLQADWQGEVVGQQSHLELANLNTEKDYLRQAVLASYDVRKDDEKMRKLLALAEPEAKKAFDALRKNYVERREFQCCSISSDRFHKVFADLGFQ